MKSKSRSKFDFLLEILQIYHDQAVRSKKCRAYLAGCVFLGAAIEGGLLATARCYPSRVRQSLKYRNKRKKDRNLDKWGFLDLLELGRELKWIPSRIPMGKIARASGISVKSDLANGDLGYFADVVREIRNLVHPGIYVRRMRNVRITESYYQFCYEVEGIVFDYLYRKLENSMRRQLSI